jgi:putative FmdB family regulatory protein
MPLYTYRCSNCGNEFDLRQGFSDDPIRICLVCDGDVRRVIQQVPVLFKGSGFYVTDNRKGKANGSGNGPKAPETAAESPESEKKDKSKKVTNHTEKKSSSASAPSKAD